MAPTAGGEVQVDVVILNNLKFKRLNQFRIKDALLYTGFFLLFLQGQAQNREISGLVRDTDGSPVPGANIVVIGGGQQGTATGSDGRFRLNVPANASVIMVSFVGFISQEVRLTAASDYTIVLTGSVSELEQVFVFSGRGALRTQTDTPLPIDIISTGNLVSTGQVSFDKALQYRVPSFNTVNTPVNDATSLFDPQGSRY